MNQSVIKLLDTERQYQDAKWGTVEEHGHTVGEWLLILEGELKEAIEAWQKKDGDSSALVEIVQVGAVAAACLEQHGSGAYYLDLQNRVQRLKGLF